VQNYEKNRSVVKNESIIFFVCRILPAGMAGIPDAGMQEIKYSIPLRYFVCT
jgi:hypothetical protein